MTDQETLQLWEEKNFEALGEAMLGLANLIASEVAQLRAVSNTELERDEIRGMAYEGMMRGINTWDPAKGVPLKTYVSKYIRWHITHEMKRHQTKRAGVEYVRVGPGDLSPEEVVKGLGLITNYEEELISGVSASLIIDKMPEIERRCLELTSQGLTLREVGAKLNTSFITVRTHLNRALAKLDVEGEEVKVGALSGPFLGLCAENATRKR